MAFTRSQERAAKRKRGAEEEEQANNGQAESSAWTKRARHETAETRPSELATLRARVQELEARESAHLAEIAALKGKVTLLTDKREKWQRVWDALTDMREVMMTEASGLRNEQRELKAQLHEDLGSVATVLNTCADLQLALTLRHRAMMDLVTGLASDSASRDSVLTEKVARIQEAMEDQAKKTDELPALSRSRQQ
ncbi:hypothetical protein PoHVEF18_007160 [Penicillium ochrochloron]